MATTLSEFALKIILNLVGSAVKKTIEGAVLDYFQEITLKNRVEAAVVSVVKPLLPFLAHENISEEKQHRLFQTCVDELSPLAQNPEQFFQGSLNGQKIFNDMYAERPLPQVVIEDDVKSTYILLFPSIAELLCKVPAAIKEWETLAWVENFRRFDELAEVLRNLVNQVDTRENKSKSQADETLLRVKQSLILKKGLEMDITTLRGTQKLLGDLSEFFVHPEIKEQIDSKDKNKPAKTITGNSDNFSQFIRSQKKNIVIGVGGAGKSTWAKWLQSEVLNFDEIGFGVCFELRNLRNYSLDSLPTIYNLVTQSVNNQHLAAEFTLEIVSYWLDKRLIVFILDGFDEVAINQRDAIYEWITDLGLAARGCPIVLTSRPITTNHLDREGIFDIRWTIEPFDLPRIIEYTQNWYNHTPGLTEIERKVDATKLAREWQADLTLKPLTSNPLLLSTLVMVHYLDGGLPPGRSQLYERYINGMLGVWDDRRKLVTTTISLTSSQKKQIIQGLALFMFLQERDQIDEVTILKWLESFLHSISIKHAALDVLLLLQERSGLIIGPVSYHFAHKSIAEYLVAEVVWDGNQKDLNGERIDRMYLFKQCDNDRWNSVIFLWAGLASKADLVTFIDSCLDVKNWALAYGILYDQYDRINDSDTRRRFLLLPELKNQEKLELFEESHSHFIFGTNGSPSFIKFNFSISTERLRSIVENILYHDLIGLALKTKTLTFDDRLIAPSKELVDLIWFLSIYENTDNVEFLKEYIHARSPLCDTDEAWCIFIAQSLLLNTLRSDKDMVSAIKICDQILPDFIGLFPLFLLSRIEYNWRIHKTHINIDQIKKALVFLPESAIGKSYPSWLLGTKNWVFNHRSSNQDLLIVFKDIMEKFVLDGILPRDNTFDRAMKYADELYEQRTVLAAQMGVDLEGEPWSPKTRLSDQRL